MFTLKKIDKVKKILAANNMCEVSIRIDVNRDSKFLKSDAKYLAKVLSSLTNAKKVPEFLIDYFERHYLHSPIFLGKAEISKNIEGTLRDTTNIFFDYHSFTTLVFPKKNHDWKEVNSNLKYLKLAVYPSTLTLNELFEDSHDDNSGSQCPSCADCEEDTEMGLRFDPTDKLVEECQGCYTRGYTFSSSDTDKKVLEFVNGLNINPRKG